MELEQLLYKLRKMGADYETVSVYDVETQRKFRITTVGYDTEGDEIYIGVTQFFDT